MTNNNITPDPVTMDGLVERVAMACCNDLPARVIAEREDADSYDEGEDEVQDYWCCIARAAIEAAGIPTLLATIEAKDEALAVVAGGDVDVSDTAIIVGNGAATVMRQIRKALKGHSHE